MAYYTYTYKKDAYTSSETASSAMTDLVQILRAVKASIVCGTLFGGEFPLYSVTYTGWHDVDYCYLQKAADSSILVKYKITITTSAPQIVSDLKRYVVNSGVSTLAANISNTVDVDPINFYEISNISQYSNLPKHYETNTEYSDVGFNPGEKTLGQLLKQNKADLEILKDVVFAGSTGSNTTTKISSSAKNYYYYFDNAYVFRTTEVSSEWSGMTDIDSYPSQIVHYFTDQPEGSKYKIQTVSITYNTDGIVTKVDASNDLSSSLTANVDRDNSPTGSAALVPTCETWTRNDFYLSLHAALGGYYDRNGAVSVFEATAGSGTAERPQYLYWRMYSDVYGKDTVIRATISWVTSGNGKGYPSSVQWDILETDKSTLLESLGTITITYDSNDRPTQETWS